MTATTFDPRTPQERIASTPSGRTVWVKITGDDRLRIIKRLPSRWPEVIMARERGDTLDEIARWAKVPPPCKPSCRFRDTKAQHGINDLGIVDVEGVSDRVHVGPECLSWHISECYNWIETALSDLAAERARLMV